MESQSQERLELDRKRLVAVITEYEAGRLSHLSEKDAEVIKLRIAQLESLIDLAAGE